MNETKEGHRRSRTVSVLIGTIAAAVVAGFLTFAVMPSAAAEPVIEPLVSMSAQAPSVSPTISPAPSPTAEVCPVEQDATVSNVAYRAEVVVAKTRHTGTDLVVAASATGTTLTVSCLTRRDQDPSVVCRGATVVPINNKTARVVLYCTAHLRDGSFRYYTVVVTYAAGPPTNLEIFVTQTPVEPMD